MVVYAKDGEVRYAAVEVGGGLSARRGSRRERNPLDDSERSDVDRFGRSSGRVAGIPRRVFHNRFDPMRSGRATTALGHSAYPQQSANWSDRAGGPHNLAASAANLLAFSPAFDRTLPVEPAPHPNRIQQVLVQAHVLGRQKMRAHRRLTSNLLSARAAAGSSRLAAAGVLVAGLIVAGCIRVAEEPVPQVDGRETSPVEPGTEATVELVVLKGPGRGTMAFVPVYIRGQGPFAFALDTGASHSAIDAAVARQLDLPAVGGSVEVTGVAANSQAVPLRVDNWSLGERVELESQVVVALALSHGAQAEGLQGLIGSDILSKYDRVTIDYTQAQLRLRPVAR